MIKKLSEKILYTDEFEIINITKSFENDISTFLGDIFIILKNNKNICHLKNDDYINKNFNTNENVLTGDIPVFLLLGGSSYKIYSKFLNKNYKNKVIDYNDNLINSLDYDISVMVEENFDNNTFRNLITEIMDNAKTLINNINLNNILEKIDTNDIKTDVFLKSKKIANVNSNKVVITFSTGKEYNSVQLSIKYKNILHQIIEFLFWKNKLLTGNISIDVLKNNKCILYQSNDMIFLLPNLAILIKTNILSMQSRLINNSYNKCTKDYYRLKYLFDVSNVVVEDIKDVINDMIINVKKIYEKENPDLFKLPFSICSLEDDNNKKKIYRLYKEFLDLDFKEQIKIMLLNDNIDTKFKNEITDIINHQN